MPRSRRGSGMYFRFDPAGDSAAPNGDRLADCAENRLRSGLRSLQRPSARERCGSWSASIRLTRRPSRVVSWEPWAARRLHREFRTARLTRPWRPIRRFTTRVSRRASSPAPRSLSNPATCLPPGGDHRGAGRQASCAVLHGVEPRPGTSDRHDHRICARNTSARAR